VSGEETEDVNTAGDAETGVHGEEKSMFESASKLDVGD
jgi:hypothetical protein